MKSDEFLGDCRPEILEYLKEMYQFHKNYDSIEILRKLSAFSARASWMRNLAIRSTNNDIIRFRIDEIDPFLDEVERQFKIYSRLISANEFEYKLTTQ